MLSLVVKASSSPKAYVSNIPQVGPPITKIEQPRKQNGIGVITANVVSSSNPDTAWVAA